MPNKDRKYPIICNDEGAPVRFGSDTDRYGTAVLYCGRYLGEEVLQSGDGICGPDKGRNCESCHRMEASHEKWNIIKVHFPGLPDEILISALRFRGGVLHKAIDDLVNIIDDREESADGEGSADEEESAVKYVESSMALPGPRPEGLSEPVIPFGEGLVDSLIEMLDEVEINIDRETAEAALRRNMDDLMALIEYIRNNSQETLKAHVQEDIEKSKNFSLEYEQFMDRRDDAIREATEQLSSHYEQTEKLMELFNRCKEFSLDKDESMLSNSRRDGHHMVEVEPKEIPNSCCCCANEIPGRFSGIRQCKNCRLCEGCVESKVVFRCPLIANGGHLHHHALKYGSSRVRDGCGCDLGERGNNECQGTTISWYCDECNIDFCSFCIGQEAPIDFDRQFGWVCDDDSGELGTGDVEGVEVNQASLMGQDFDACTAERVAAARWEGVLQRDVSEGEVIVGTGLIGTTAPFQSETGRKDINYQISVDLGRSADGPLSPESVRALESFTTTHGGADVTAACDIVHVEEMLHHAERVGNKHISLALQQAIAAGRVEIAGTLLMAPTFAVRSNSENGNEMMCFCGLEINSETAPGGAVGCLRGHPMHAGCAADQLLGGGHCPTCRCPLFYPKVPGPEARAAKEFATAELERCQREEEEKMRQEAEELSKQGLKVTLQHGDLVRISPDVDYCRDEMMKRPALSGWSDEIASACGMMGRVAEVFNDEATAVTTVRVLTKDSGHIYGYGKRKFTCKGCFDSYNDNETRGFKCIHCHKCQRCCQKSSSHSCVASVHDWKWPTSCLTLLCRSTAASLWDISLADKESAAAAQAEQHIMRLRAELRAVAAARDAVREEMNVLMRPTLSIQLSRELSDKSSIAVMGAVDKVSPADWHRARHLLLLARQWGESEDDRAKRKYLYESVRSGEMDTVARIVRRYNASRVADAARWADAVSEKGEYVVEQFAKVDLRAWPSEGSPKTGFSLEPKARFLSKSEKLDSAGRLWIQVDESSFVDLSTLKGRVESNLKEPKLLKYLVGARVVRGSDWHEEYGDQDGGEGKIGVIRSINNGGWVSVCWSNGNTRDYRAGAKGKFDLNFAGPPPPPPQGWLCTRPSGLGSPAVVRKGRSALRCFGCGDGLLPESQSCYRYSLVKNGDNVQKGDSLLVAATLEPIEVVSFEEDKVVCKFVGASAVQDEQLNNSECTVWYRHEDLVYPHSKSALTYEEDEMVLVDGHLRSRREIVLMCGNEADARAVWNGAKGTKKGDGLDESDEIASYFASCARGHLLHARCFQGALLAGQSCPQAGCSEPLWVPRVTSQQQDETTCCESDRRDEEAIQDAADLVGREALAKAREEAGEVLEDNITIAGIQELKMCPACLSGPLFNENCNDMTTHHGECSASALSGAYCSFRVSAVDITTALMEVTEDKPVTDVLPKCPEHNVLVMFNGCMACGHLFTDTPWRSMPKWDPHAKAVLALDKKKRQAATLLAEQIRKEVAHLQFERNALKNTWGGKDIGLVGEMPPLPPHAEEFTGCAASCTASHHRDGPCLFCGRRWMNHNGHVCNNGERGSWIAATGAAQWEDDDDDDDGDY